MESEADKTRGYLLASHQAERQKWDRRRNKKTVKMQEDSTDEAVDVKHEEYLLHLQEKNRMLRHMKQKDARTKALEKREQGFSLYLNGANDKELRKQAKRTNTSAGLKDRRRGSGTNDKLRQKTAPEVRREQWMAASVDIQTNEGKMHYKAPVVLTGNYSDDFDSSGSDDGDKEMLTLSLADVSKLRKSMTATIQERIRQESSGSSSSSLEEGGSASSDNDEARGTKPLVGPRESFVLEFAGSKKSPRKAKCLQSSRKEGYQSQEMKNRIDQLMTRREGAKSKLQVSAVIKKSTIEPDHGKQSNYAIKLQNSEAGTLTTDGGTNPSKLMIPSSKDHRGDSEHHQITSHRMKKLNIHQQEGSKHSRGDSLIKVPKEGHPPVVEELKSPQEGRKPAVKIDEKGLNKSCSHPSTLVEEQSKQIPRARPKSSNHHREKMQTEQRPASANSLIKETASTDLLRQVHERPSVPRPPLTKGTGLQKEAGKEENTADLGTIMRRVEQLDKISQRKLFKALSIIEEKTDNVQKPLKTAAPTDDTSSLTLLDVTLTILSSWDGGAFVGLTEVHFYDSKGRKMEVTDMFLNGQKIEALHKLRIITDGRCKTVKDRHMWHSTDTLPLQIRFLVRNSRRLSRIKFWNYNRSQQLLGRGAKDIRLSIGGKEVFGGQLEKACGNNIFDYGQNVHISCSEKSSKEKEKEGATSSKIHASSGATNHQSSPKSGSSKLPSWLDEKTESGRFPSPPVSRAGQRDAESTQNGIEEWPLLLDTQELENVVTPMQRISSAREEKNQKRLERSWSSIDMFNRSQRGRLSIDMNDDALDQYMIERRECESRLANQTLFEKPEAAYDDDDEFSIPNLPSGKTLLIQILSTWGDKFYVGLNGIEMFTASGLPAKIQSITADPADINVLGEYGDDPRVAANLVDGVYRTHDDVHLWLAPFKAGLEHTITVHFEALQQIAMIRIWNYNKSRAHALRGVRAMRMLLDGEPVFAGEIECASGGLAASDAYGDTILFTLDDDILEQVARNDVVFDATVSDESDTELIHNERPLTAEKNARPQSSAVRKNQNDRLETLSGELLVKTLTIDFVDTWGDSHYLGLTGIQLLDLDHQVVSLNPEMLHGEPRDLTVLPGYEDDERTLDKLIDGTNLTMEDHHMWLTPFTSGESHLIIINLSKPTCLTGFFVWNYNKSPEDTYRGARLAHISVNGCRVSPPGGVILRKGPGNCYFDFSQKIQFADFSEDLECGEESFSNDLPCGFIYQLQLLTTWGDPYYVGLNGLKFFSPTGEGHDLSLAKVAAYPSSINVLPGVTDDVRLPENLVNGFNDTEDAHHMWLSPILPNIVNRVFVVFDLPTKISMIQLWNYSKTAGRGVKDVALLVDDLLVYNGTLSMAGVTTGILPTARPPQRHHTILLSEDRQLAEREKNSIVRNRQDEQDVQLTNDHKLVQKFNNPKSTKGSADPMLRPTTCVPNRRK